LIWKRNLDLRQSPPPNYSPEWMATTTPNQLHSAERFAFDLQNSGMTAKLWLGRGFKPFAGNDCLSQLAMIANQTTNATDGELARVLIVDDEPDIAKVLALLLKTRGYAVEVVTDSTQCLSRLESFRPNLIFLDIAMPKISGYDLAKQIRVQGDVPIIALSGYADREHTQRSIEAGCNQHLAKPVSLATLEAVISHEVFSSASGA
jgi:two-component system, OmpR family, response regulator